MTTKMHLKESNIQILRVLRLRKKVRSLNIELSIEKVAKKKKRSKPKTQLNISDLSKSILKR